MKNAGRIIIVSELFYPEESATAHIMTRIADHLGRDREVLIITGPESYEGEKKRITSNTFDTRKIAIERAWAPNLNKNKLTHRAARFMVLSFGLAWMTFTRARRCDLLLSVTNPAPLVVFLALIRKIKKTPYILLVHDVFPENSVAAGIIRKTSPLYKIIKHVFDWAYSSADSIITIGRDMAELVESKTKTKNTDRIKIIENWADLEKISQIPRMNSKIPVLGLEKKLVIGYAGNIGRAQGILEFVEELEKLSNNSVHFLFAGSGALRNSLESQLQKFSNASMLDAFSRSEQSLILGSCDIALVVLGRDMYGLGVPSKTYNAMAAGKPILFLGPKNSEIYRLVKDHNIGWAFDWGNLKELTQLLNSLTISNLPETEKMGINARKVAEIFFTEKIAMEKIGATIECVAHNNLK